MYSPIGVLEPLLFPCLLCLERVIFIIGQQGLGREAQLDPIRIFMTLRVLVARSTQSRT